MAYLQRIQKTESAACILCAAGLPDDAEHTFEDCEEFTTHRRNFLTQARLEPPVTSRKLVEYMMRDRSSWSLVSRFVGEVISVTSRVVNDHMRRLTTSSSQPSPTPPPLALDADGLDSRATGPHG